MKVPRDKTSLRFSAPTQAPSLASSFPLLGLLGVLLTSQTADAQSFGDLHVDPLSGELIIGIELRDEKRSSQTSDLTQEEFLTREILKLGTAGYYYHPKLAEFNFRAALGFEQQMVSTDNSANDSRANTFFPNWDLRTRLFKDQAYTGELYSFRNETYARRNFFPTTRTTITETGANLIAKELIVPSRLHYHRYEFNSDGLSSQDQVRDNVTLTGSLLNNRHQFSYGFEFNAIEQDQSALSYDDVSGNLSSTLFIGDERALRWNNFARGRYQRGNVAIDTLAGSSQLYRRWNASLNSNLGVQYNRTESQAAFNEATTISAGMDHQLYASLTSAFSVQLGRTRLDGGNIEVDGGAGQFAYKKITPIGRLGLQYSADYYVQRQDDLSGLSAVFDESHLHTAGIPIFLANQSVDFTTVLVTDITGLTIFTEGSDYILVAIGNQLRIDIPVGSLINSGDTILVDYSFAPNPQIEFSNLAQTIGMSFDFGQTADLRVSYSQVEQTLNEGVDTGILTDSRRKSAAFNLHPGAANVGVAYEDYDSDFAPFSRTSFLASYQKSINKNSLLRLSTNTYETEFDGQADKERGTSASLSFISGTGRSAVFQLTGKWRSIDNSTDEGTGIGIDAGWTYKLRAIRLSLNLRYSDEEFVVASDQRTLSLFFVIARSF